MFLGSLRMVKPEYTGKRDLSYNKWHRTIGDSYYMIDLDCVEWRSNKGTVAIIERALDMQKYPLEQIIEYKKFELTVASEIAEKLKVPAYLVFYNPQLTEFKIYIIQQNNAQFYKTMNDTDYADFLRKL